MVITLVMMISGITTAVEAGEDAAPVMFTSSGEEKVYCNATLEDDFAENRVMIVLSNDASLDFSTYGASDFAEVECAGVKNLSRASGRKIQAKAEALKAAVLTRSVDLSTLDTSGIDTYNQVLCLELEDGGKENVLAAIDELMKRDDVIYAGPDYVISLCATTPVDEYYNHEDNWAPEVIDLPEAWDISTGSAEVVVGVIDSGIDATHEDLKANIDITHSADFSTGGFVSNVSTDLNGHGTHVAGIIAAVGDNGKGAAGVCWNIKLISLCVFDSSGNGYSSYVANAINYAEEMDIPILNYSGGGGDNALESVIENYAGLFICSAGNDANDNDAIAHYPSNYNLPNLIAVGASTREDIPWFVGYYLPVDGVIYFIIEKGSNYGQTTVDLFAPGADIFSCYPGGICKTKECEDYTKYAGGECLVEGYHSMSGTSMAAPYVTGVAALLLSQHPDMLPCEIKDTILTNVDDCGELFDDLCVTGGRLNAYKALTNIQRHETSYWDFGYDSGHRIHCDLCNYSENQPHNFEHIARYNSLQHAISCDCGHAIYESHLWNTTKTKCLVCGYDISGPSVAYALRPDEE